MGRVDPTALALCIVFPILSIIAVAARFRARKIQKAKLLADDWIIIPALLFSLGNAVNILYGAVVADLGQHMPLDRAGWAVNGPKLVALNKMTYVTEVVACVALACSRWSVLLFYGRIFATRKFRIAVYIMSALNIGWMIAFVFAFLFKCTPIKEVWTSQEGKRKHCIGIEANYYYAVISVVLDVMVLSMPWTVIWRLQMQMKQKIAVTAIFMLGAIVTAAGIGKVYAFFTVGAKITKNKDFSYDEAPLFYWTLPECSLAVVCACLPTLRPIFHGMSPESLIRSVRSVFSLSSFRTNNESTRAAATYSSSWENNEPHDSKVGFRKMSTEPGSVNADMELNDVERGNIRVTRKFEVKEGTQ